MRLLQFISNSCTDMDETFIMLQTAGVSGPSVLAQRLVSSRLYPITALCLDYMRCYTLHIRLKSSPNLASYVDNHNIYAAM